MGCSRNNSNFVLSSNFCEITPPTLNHAHVREDDTNQCNVSLKYSPKHTTSNSQSLNKIYSSHEMGLSRDHCLSKRQRLSAFIKVLFLRGICPCPGPNIHVKIIKNSVKIRDENDPSRRATNEWLILSVTTRLLSPEGYLPCPMAYIYTRHSGLLQKNQQYMYTMDCTSVR